MVPKSPSCVWIPLVATTGMCGSGLQEPTVVGAPFILYGERRLDGAFRLLQPVPLALARAEDPGFDGR